MSVKQEQVPRLKSNGNSQDEFIVGAIQELPKKIVIDSSSTIINSILVHVHGNSITNVKRSSFLVFFPNLVGGKKFSQVFDNEVGAVVLSKHKNKTKNRLE